MMHSHCFGPLLCPKSQRRRREDCPPCRPARRHHRRASVHNFVSTFSALPTSVVNTDSRVGWLRQESLSESGSAVRSLPPPPPPRPASARPGPAQSIDLSFEFIVCYAHTYAYSWPFLHRILHSPSLSCASLGLLGHRHRRLFLTSFLPSLPPSLPPTSPVSHTNLTPNSATHELAVANAQPTISPPPPSSSSASYNLT